MHEFALLRDLVILVAVALPVVVVAQRLRLPTLVGFLLTGVAIGPHGFGVIGQPDSVAALAEIGVVLLLFAIGLELSLSRIIKLGRTVLVGGLLQMGGTIVAGALIARAFSAPVNQAVFLGALVALSSTAIVLKVITDRGELDTAPGRVVIAILLFQDLCVVPLMVLLPVLAGGDPTGDAPGALQIGMALVVTTLLVVVGRIAVPRLLERVAAVRNREIFTLCIVVVGLGAAYVTASVGLSLALGAFIAGLVVSESEYGLQALSDVLPFRDTFSGIFFTSVGMLLDVGFVADHLMLVLGATLGLVVLKAVIAGGVVRALQRTFQVSVISGLALAQVGEFSFILADVAEPLGLLSGDSYQLFLGVSVLSMLAAPFIIQVSGPVADWVERMRGGVPAPIAPHEAEAAQALVDHVIVVGYGLNGRNLAHALKGAGIPYVILEQNGQVVRQARLNREPIIFGDATRHEVLERVGITRARVIVFAISAPAEERRGVAVARHLNPDISVVVRTRYVKEIEELERLGADQVIPEEFETSLEIFARVLRLYGVPANTIRREVDAVRGEHYEMLRGLALPALKFDALRHLGTQIAIETVEVEAESRAVGESPATLAMRRVTGCTVLAAIRDGTAHYTPDPQFRFNAGDLVVLVGTVEAVTEASRMFRKPRAGDRRSGALRATGTFGVAGSITFHPEGAGDERKEPPAP
ncbi:MAG TPA: cation:proton antiporter [Gemmatimonadales bacterium]|nr:cation:proton antiporter [Gemmatimonadales bacterium]